MPNMPAWVLGLFNYRNHVIWAVDLSHLLGFAPLEQGLVDHLLAILRIDEQVIAAAVAQVKGVIRLSPERIEWGGASQVDQSPSLPGKTVLANETLLILDPEALARQTGFAVSPLTD
jgi:chemotaxis signal transduction protein